MTITRWASDSPPKGTPSPLPSVFETRFDALVSRMNHLAKVAGCGSIGNELRDVATELVRLRRDMANVTIAIAQRTSALVADMEKVLDGDVTHLPARRPYAARGTATKKRSENPGARNGKARAGTQLVHGEYVTPPKGRRYCAAHNDGEGAFLKIEEFKVKNPATGQLTSWCAACTRKYQQDRYVRVGYKRVTIELKEGDPCVGHDCPLCGFPMEIGERVQGVDVAHETCRDTAEDKARG